MADRETLVERLNGGNPTAALCREAAASLTRLTEELSAERAKLARAVEDNAELRYALQLTSGALQAGQLSMARKVAFTGEWSHFGTRLVSDILDTADAVLGSPLAEVEGGNG